MRKTSFSRIVSLIMLMILTVLPLSSYVSADEEPIPDEPSVERCQSAYLFNVENDRVLFKYNPTEQVYPASTVKLMTAIVAFEYFADDLDSKITVTRDMLAEVSGNRIGFYEGEVVSARQMLNCMLVNSANDAAIILAHGVAGSTSAFVRMMNDKAAWIGAYETTYTNPTGLHDDLMVTTAQDTAVIAKYAYSIPGFIEITSTSKYVMDSTNRSDYRSIYNRNCMISKYYNVNYYYPDAIGMNAGATTQGGYAICAAARNDASNLTYIAVVLGAEGEGEEYYNYINAINMLDWAFKAYTYAQVLSSSRVICELPVNLSSTLDYVTLVPEKSITSYLPANADLSEDIQYSYNTYTDSLDAPVEAGDVVGTITVMYKDEILGSCALITTSSIARSEFLNILSNIREFTKSRFFIATVISIAVLAVAYILFKARQREKKLRRIGGGRI